LLTAFLKQVDGRTDALADRLANLESQGLIPSLGLCSEDHDGWASYLHHMVEDLQQKLGHSINSEVVDNHLIPLLTSIQLFKVPTANPLPLVLLLQSILSVPKGIRRAFTQPQVLHLISHTNFSDDFKADILKCYDPSLAFLATAESMVHIESL